MQAAAAALPEPFHCGLVGFGALPYDPRVAHQALLTQDPITGSMKWHRCIRLTASSRFGLIL